MATIANIKPGQTLWEVVSHRMGNTTHPTQSLYEIRVLEVNVAEGWVLARWGFNKERRYRAHHVRRWKVNKPERREGIMGSVRYGSRRKTTKGASNEENKS